MFVQMTPGMVKNSRARALTSVVFCLHLSVPAKMLSGRATPVALAAFFWGHWSMSTRRRSISMPDVPLGVSKVNEKKVSKLKLKFPRCVSDSLKIWFWVWRGGEKLTQLNKRIFFVEGCLNWRNWISKSGDNILEIFHSGWKIKI